MLTINLQLFTYFSLLLKRFQKLHESHFSFSKDFLIFIFADVTVEYCRGLPQLTVPLPSRREKCLFTLKPISNCVGDFIEMLKKEDKGIDRVIASTMDGTRIASSNTIEHLLAEDFKLVINDNTYKVHPPKHERLTNEEAKQ